MRLASSAVHSPAEIGIPSLARCSNPPIGGAALASETLLGVIGGGAFASTITIGSLYHSSRWKAGHAIDFRVKLILVLIMLRQKQRNRIAERAGNRIRLMPVTQHTRIYTFPFQHEVCERVQDVIVAIFWESLDFCLNCGTVRQRI